MIVGIITSGFLPVPATKGGAVENLIVNVLNKNEKENKADFNIFSVFDQQAVEESKKYKYSKFVFIRIPQIVKVCDKIIFFIAKNILKKHNSQSYRYIIQRLYYLKRVSSFIKNNDYDKILLENHPTQYLALKWNKNYIKYKDRYYYHCHNEFPGTYRCDEIIKNTRKIICVSKFIKNSIKNCIGNIDEQKFYVLRNCVDKEKFSGIISEKEKQQIRAKYGIENDEKILLFTGRVVPEKGVKELIESLKYVKSTKYRLMILGAPLNEINTKTEYQLSIENLIKEMGNKVIFTGFIKYSEIAKFYALADFAVLPSMWNDPAPLTIIESLASGLPIITTNSGGIPEYANSESAIILDRNTDLKHNLASAIDEMISDDEKRQSMSEEGKKISRDLTLENFYNNFINSIS